MTFIFTPQVLCLIFRDVQQQVTNAVFQTFCTEPHQLSMLFVLWVMGCTGGFGCYDSSKGGTAQTRRIFGGAQQLPVLVARQLKGL